MIECKKKSYICCQQLFTASSTETNELVADLRLLFKQYKLCEKQKELTDEFKAKVIL